MMFYNIITVKEEMIVNKIINAVTSRKDDFYV